MSASKIIYALLLLVFINISTNTINSPCISQNFQEIAIYVNVLGSSELFSQNRLSLSTSPTLDQRYAHFFLTKCELFHRNDIEIKERLESKAAKDLAKNPPKKIKKDS